MELNNIYEERFNNIIRDYGFVRSGAVDAQVIHNIIMSAFQHNCPNRRVALWGAGKSNSKTSHASFIIRKYASILQSMVCIIDSSRDLWGKEYLGYRIISPEEIRKNNIEVIIVASHTSAQSIKESIKIYAPDATVLDIYEILKQNGIELYYNFFDAKDRYSETYDLRVKYEQLSENDKNKGNGCKSPEAAEALHELIAAYLSIKDFVYAFKYMDEYIEKKYQNYDNTAKLQKELRQLLEELKEKNESRDCDITLHFLDAFRAMDAYDGSKKEFKVLKDFFKKSVYFENAYSTGPVTYESMIAIIEQQYSFTKNVYADNFLFDINKFPLMLEAEKRGMEIDLYSFEAYPIMQPTDRINFIYQIHMAEKFFTLACRRAASPKPLFSILYSPWELHFPLACGFHTQKPVTMGFSDVGVKDMSSFIRQQHADCLKYVDRQFDFYEKILGDASEQAVFSDHSQIVYDEEHFWPFYKYYNNKERQFHCVLALKPKKNSKLKPYVESRYISMIDFNRILVPALFEDRLNVPDRRYLQFSYYNIHNQELRRIARERGFTDYIDGISGAMDDKYLYIETIHGKCELYRQSDITENIYSYAGAKEVADDMKKYCDFSFPQFLKDKAAANDVTE